MIPKNLFFTWVGDEKPKYVDNVVNEFRAINPSFRIFTYFMTIKDVQNSNDECVKRTYDYINDTLFLNKKNKYYDYIKMVTQGSGKRGFVAYFSDILRWELIEKHGGIYCDCDTWPIRPFDDILLQSEHFNAVAHPDNREYFFFGAIPGINSWFDIYNENIVLKEKNIYNSLDYSFNTYLFKDNAKFNNLRDKHLNCCISRGDYYVDQNHYLDHYRSNHWKDSGWKNNHTEIDVKFNTNF